MGKLPIPSHALPVIRRSILRVCSGPAGLQTFRYPRQAFRRTPRRTPHRPTFQPPRPYKIYPGLVSPFRLEISGHCRSTATREFRSPARLRKTEPPNHPAKRLEASLLASETWPQAIKTVDRMVWLVWLVGWFGWFGWLVWLVWLVGLVGWLVWLFGWFGWFGWFGLVGWLVG